MRYYLALVCAACMCLPGMASAAGLVDVYQQALQSDPTYQVAVSTYRAAQEQVPIAQSKLLPDIDLTGSLTHSHTFKRDPNSSSSTETGVFALSLTQALFDVADSRALQSAKASVRAARAQYNAANQALIMRVADAYFAVLEAHDSWVASQSLSRALAKQMQQTQQRFDVGLDAITAVQEVRAKYDNAVATQLAAANGLTNALENLRALTNQEYSDLASLPSDHLPLLRPMPANLSAWVEQAQQHNFDIKAARATADASHEALLAAEDAHLPVIAATGGYTYTRNSDTTLSVVQASHVPSVGVSIAMPLYSGGAISATARKAAYNEALAESTAVQVTRGALNQTRQSYLGVMAGISQVQATRQALHSSVSTLHSTREAYLVGTRDLTDILTAQANLYAAQENHAQQQYAYLKSMLQLKQAAGTLSPSDLTQISQWFRAPIQVGRYYHQVALADIKAASMGPIDHGGKPLPLPKRHAVLLEPGPVVLPVPVVARTSF